MFLALLLRQRLEREREHSEKLTLGGTFSAANPSPTNKHETKGKLLVYILLSIWLNPATNPP